MFQIRETLFLDFGLINIALFSNRHERERIMKEIQRFFGDCIHRQRSNKTCISPYKEGIYRLKFFFPPSRASK